MIAAPTFVQSEGGPHLNGALLDADCVDELDLTISPVLCGGTGPRLTVGAAPTLTRFDAGPPRRRRRLVRLHSLGPPLTPIRVLDTRIVRPVVPFDRSRSRGGSRRRRRSSCRRWRSGGRRPRRSCAGGRARPAPIWALVTSEPWRRTPSSIVSATCSISPASTLRPLVAAAIPATILARSNGSTRPSTLDDHQRHLVDPLERGEAVARTTGSAAGGAPPTPPRRGASRTTLVSSA